MPRLKKTDRILVDQPTQEWAFGLTPQIQEARLKVLIFLYIRHFGWGKVTIKPSKKNPEGRPTYSWSQNPVQKVKALGYPNEDKIWKAVRDVRAVCLEEANLYKKVMAERREAERRYKATTFKHTWEIYLGDGGPNSLVYQSKVARFRGKGYFFKQKGGYVKYKYAFHELLPRMEERKRAKREIKEAEEKLEALKDAIFEKMGVPPQFRRMV